jgi:hypothetical protein
MRPAERSRQRSWKIHSGASAQGGRECCPRDTHPRKGSEPEYENRAQDDVEAVRQPQDPHRDRRVPRTSENRVVQEEEKDDRSAAEHDSGVGHPVLEDPRRRPHQLEERFGEDDSYDRQGRRGQEGDHDGLDSGSRSGLAILLADAPRHDGRRADAEAHGNRVDDRQHRLRQTHSSNCI